MKDIISFVVGLIIFFLLLFFYSWTVLLFSPVQSNSPKEAKIPRLMRYHGTYIAVKRGGSWYFPRDGKFYRLWDPEERK